MSTLTRTVLAAAPANLAAQAISASAINLTWTARAGATGYRVYRNGALIGSPTTNSFSDTGLAASTIYTYTVSTVAATGEGPQGAAVQGTTLAEPDTTAPTAPVITATATGQNTVSVALTTPATDSQSGVASYDLEYKTAAAATYTAITGLAANQFPYVIGSLTPATTYNNRARARDGVGNIGPYSAISNATTQAAQSGADPYPLYTSFDRNDIPWHAAAGVWGAQVPLQAPATPNTTATVDVTTTGGFISAIQTGARVVRVMSNIGDATGVTPGNDTDIVIMPGVRVGTLQFSGAFSRLRIRGPVVGMYSGGSIAKWGSNAATGTPQTDIIFDGIGISGSGGGDGFVIQPHFGIDRMAILNCRIRAGVAIAFMSSVRHLFVANTSAIAGVNGPGVTWGFRHDDDGPIVFVDVDFRTPFAPGVGAYHRIRSKPPTGQTSGKHFYVDDSVFVDSGQSTFLWANLTSASQASDRHSSMIVRRVRTYSGGAGGNGTIYPEAVGLYAEVTGGQYFGRPSVGDLASSESGSLAATKNFSNNQFFAYAGDPAWTAAGDPTSLPMT